MQRTCTMVRCLTTLSEPVYELLRESLYDLVSLSSEEAKKRQTLSHVSTQ